MVHPIQNHKESKMLKSKAPKYIAEALGTFFLVFTGCAAVVVNNLYQGALGHLGISLVFGWIVLAMIYTVGHISGAHLNPAVTLAFIYSGRLPRHEGPLYILGQLTGSLLAAVALKIIFVDSPISWGETIPSGSWAQSFLMEYLLTSLLMFVVMGVATDHRAEGTMAGVAIGGTICLAALIGGPISGASLNPVRSLAPAILSGHFDHHWIYWVAPILGGLTGVFMYQKIACFSETNPTKSGCC